MSRLIGWLACLGTPKAGPVVYCTPTITEYRRLTGYNSWLELAKSRSNKFSLTKEEYDVRELWLDMLDTNDYLIRTLKMLPKHFKIGSIVFLWDKALVEGDPWSLCYSRDKFYIMSYIDGRPELDNGECTITKVYGDTRTWYELENSDLFMYIMNNLDKVVAQ